MINSVNLKCQCVRDLAWVMSSPSMLALGPSPYVGEKVSDVWCQSVYQQNLDWLHQLDVDPAPLQQWLDQKQSPLLGIYFESLLAFWLQHLPDTELLAQNLKVGQPGLQLGEFDLLFRDLAQQQLIHWEVTVKFYLRYGSDDYQWLGPNPRDSLQRKLNKVFDHQLRLSEQPKAQQVLQYQLGQHQPTPQAVVKGYLFYPYDSDWRKPIEIPAGVSANHLKGWWCRHADMPVRLALCETDNRWMLLPRLQWLSPVVRYNMTGLMDENELLGCLTDYFSEYYKAVLLVELKVGDDGWSEVSRGFVVNDEWPR